MSDRQAHWMDTWILELEAVEAERDRLAGRCAELEAALTDANAEFHSRWIARDLAARIDALLSSAGPPQEADEWQADEAAAQADIAAGRVERFATADEAIAYLRAPVPPPERRCLCTKASGWWPNHHPACSVVGHGTAQDPA